MLLSAVIWREQVIMLGNVRWKASPDGTSVLLPVFYLPFPSIRPLSCFNMHVFEPWEENLEKSQTNSKNMQNPHRKSFSLTWEMNPGLSGFCCEAPSCHFNIQNLNMNEDVMMFWYLQYILGREHTVDIQQTKVKLVFHSRVSSENAQPWYEQRFSSRLQSCKGSMLSSYNGASLNLPRGCLATAPHLHLQEVRRSPLPPLSHRQAFHVPLSLFSSWVTELSPLLPSPGNAPALLRKRMEHISLCPCPLFDFSIISNASVFWHRPLKMQMQRGRFSITSLRPR